MYLKVIVRKWLLRYANALEARRRVHIKLYETVISSRHLSPRFRRLLVSAPEISSTTDYSVFHHSTKHCSRC
jgi:hypothetical protein